ncbi:MAG: septum site-determining protein MinD [Candidatus Caenarcaniphilales bacterium]|jgi:septum site-determining protein MinD|nr:septum site-determining protein MinD [Candidatus Caenarcaniphilales bacterium]
MTETEINSNSNFAGKVIVVTSGKGGVGKTTTTANIGAALAGLGKNTCVIDMDIGLRNLDILMGLENRVVYNLVEVIEGTCKLKQALVRDKKFPNLSLLPAAQTRDKTSVNAEQVKALIEEVRKHFDFVLVDCPAGIESGFQNSIAGADEALVVVTPEMSSVRDADRIVGLLEARRDQIGGVHLIVNRIKPGLIETHQMMSIEDIQEILALDLIGMVPDDEDIVVSTNKGEPLSITGSNKSAGQAYRNIARRLTGEEVPFMDLNKRLGFMGRIKAMFA